MFSLSTYFSIIPHEVAVLCYAAAAEDAVVSECCKAIITGMVNSVASSAELTPHVEGFAMIESN